MTRDFCPECGEELIEIEGLYSKATEADSAIATQAIVNLENILMCRGCFKETFMGTEHD